MRKLGFAAIARPDARVLILGSLPGDASLACGQYYAQPRNVFWRIMVDLVGAEPAMPYAERLNLLVARRIAGRAICAAANRPGSAESAFGPDTVRANDMAGFLRSHPDIQLICFNGAKAGGMAADTR